MQHHLRTVALRAIDVDYSSYKVPYPDLIVGSVLLLVAIFAGGVEGLREGRRRG